MTVIAVPLRYASLLCTVFHLLSVELKKGSKARPSLELLSMQSGSGRALVRPCTAWWETDMRHRSIMSLRVAALQWPQCVIDGPPTSSVRLTPPHDEPSTQSVRQIDFIQTCAMWRHVGKQLITLCLKKRHLFLLLRYLCQISINSPNFYQKHTTGNLKQKSVHAYVYMCIRSYCTL